MTDTSATLERGTALVSQCVVDLERRGVTLLPVGDGLRVFAPTGAVTREERAFIAGHKRELLSFLRPAMKDFIVVDFETRSRAKLRSIGGRLYAADPSTEVIAFVALMPDGSWLEWCPGRPPPTALFDRVAAGAKLVAHNAATFDWPVWDALGWPKATWVDTVPIARSAGLRASLEHLAEDLLDERKDIAGSMFTKKLSAFNERTGVWRVALTAEVRERVFEYCRQDVWVLGRLWRAHLFAHAQVEADLRELDVIINERGFAIDVDLARAIVALTSDSALRQDASIDDALVRSPAKLKAWLAQRGFLVADVRRTTLQRLRERKDLPDEVRRAVEARGPAASTHGAKLKGLLCRVSPDGRLRDSLVFHGAHTGRWSGRGFQPQNLPRGVLHRLMQEPEHA